MPRLPIFASTLGGKAATILGRDRDRAPQPIQRNGIAYQLFSIYVMRVQEQTVVFHQCVDEERDAKSD
jgi:hypothetical protein